MDNRISDLRAMTAHRPLVADLAGEVPLGAAVLQDCIALPATPTARQQPQADQHGGNAPHDATAQRTSTATPPTITRWVTAHCTPVPPTTYNATASLHLHLHHCNQQTNQ